MEKIILYGAGKDGIAALRILGKENVICFCDNKLYKDNSIEGIKVVSFEELLKTHKDKLVVITASTIRSVYEITKQLAENKLRYSLLDEYMECIFSGEAKRYEQLNVQRDNFRYSDENKYFISRDMGKAAGSFGSYFWQDLWAAKHIFNDRPELHFDIGSRVDGFIAHLLSFGQKVKQIDIRPLESKVEGWEFVQADATLLEEIEDNSIKSLSALCSLEHFGLGRYGDEIDPEACFKCFNAIQKKLSPGGAAYVSVPISGIEHLEFNAHRVFHPQTIVAEFRDLELIEFSACEGDDFYHNVDIHRFDEYTNKGGKLFGLFYFRKQ